MDLDKNAESIGHSKRRILQVSGAPMLHSATRAEPDNKFYEVEAILDGPRKRREHLFKLCYKVRWKGYGPEADTWQPIADLANVQDMIDDFKKERAIKQREKGKKFTDRNQDSGSRARTKRQMSDEDSDDDDDDDDDKQYDPVYGTVKDKFWKDLELGRHQNHAQLFSGDMYSKVKGCRRAAHAEAVASIQRQQHIQSKSPPASHQSSPKHVQTTYLSKSTSVVASLSLKSSTRSKSLKASSVGKAQKRSYEPFSARGYMSIKRSRRSREAKNETLSPENKRSPVGSASSETIGLDTNSSPVLPIVESNISEFLPSSANIESSSIDQSVSSTHLASPIDEDTKIVAAHSDSVIVETVVTDYEIQSHDNEKRSSLQTSQLISASEAPDVSVQQETDSSTQETNICASGTSDSASTEQSVDPSSAKLGGELCDPSVINKNCSPKRSTLDGQAEANGAVERAHDEDCLWNGACNRSDCKSNRRRNMKHGQRKGIGVRKVEEADTENHISEDETLMGNENQNNSDYVTTESGHHGNICESLLLPKSKVEEDEQTETECENVEELSTSSLQSEVKSFSDSLSTGVCNSSSQILTSDPAGHSPKDSNTPLMETGHLKQHLSHRQPHKLSEAIKTCSSGQACQPRDSSCDSSPFGLSQKVIGKTFQVDPQAQSLHVDPLGGTSINKMVSHGSVTTEEISHSTNFQQNILCKKSGVGVERPGLFSDNNGAFIFTRQDSGFSGGSGSATPGEQQGQCILSPVGSISVSSPGKENFGSLKPPKSCGLVASDAYIMHQMPVDTFPNSQFETGSHVHSLTFQQKMYSETSDGWSSRKWNSEISQPLEKVSSPNIRDSDLDRRISTLSCDELEDFEEQGERHYCQKDMAFVSDADLLQAVNLNKTEVVKHAITQSRLSEQKLDLEQPDSTGLTLLMRAVQKGNIAVLEMLLEHGVNVNAQQTNGTTALMIAAEQNALCLVALLLKYGANSSLYTTHSEQPETALMKAIKRHHREVVNLMLRVGVNIAAPTCTGLSALQLAVAWRNPHIERMVRSHCQRLEQAFRNRVLAALEGTAELLEPLFPLQCFPLRESNEFVVRFNGSIHPVIPGEGYLLFIAHTKITENSVKCRLHGGSPIGSVTLNGIVQSPLTKEINFVTSCHPVVPGCNILVIDKQADYTSKAKLVVEAFRCRLLSY